MIDQLGSMPFGDEYLSEDTVGRWVIEKDPGKEPRMYVDDVMLGLIGLEKQTNPEDTFKAWLAGIDKNYMDSVAETERMNTNGIRAEVVYPWHYPDGHTILIRCEGIRNYDYKAGVRTEGRHRNITNLTRLQKEAAVISALSDDFECVDYVMLNGSADDDVLIPFRISERMKAAIPVWEKEISFHNRLQMLIDAFGVDKKAQKFYAQTRRDVILSHLEKEPAYYVNTRAVVEDGSLEYFQLKFMADRDDSGKIVGIVVGIHSIDDEMREELQLRLKVERLVDNKTEELKNKNEALAKVNERIISMIGEIVESRDEDSGNHINRVNYLTRILGVQVMKDCPEYNLTVEDVVTIARLSSLHDVGKIKIPDSILLKEGPLSDEEFEIMKTHCEKGCDIIRKMTGILSDDLVSLSMDICRYHHEKWDGSGYPIGLKGDDIPISAQIVSIADAYDALVSERCYKRAFTHDEAYNMIIEGKCGMYSEKILSCLSKCRKAFADSSIYTDEFSEFAEETDISSLTGGECISDAMFLAEELSESMPGGFFIYQADEERKLLCFNNLMVEYMGCSSREEFIEFTGNSFNGIVHPDDLAKINQDINNQIDTSADKVDHVIYRIIRKDGTVRWLDNYGRFIKSSDMGDVFFVFAIDFTEVYLHRNDNITIPERNDSLPNDSAKGALRNLRVLVVDDSEISRSLHKELLEEEGAVVEEAENGQEAVNAVINNMDYDLILMGLVMPVMNGVTATREITELLKAEGKYTTIVCLTAEGADMLVSEALEAGAYECIYKPLNISELSGLVIASIRDNTHRMEKKLAETIMLANTDSLTNVNSIAAFTDRIAELSSRMTENNSFEFGVVLCDCDKLKEVNDNFGHDIGDRYIINTSLIICDVFKHSSVYRIGGDEFVVIVKGTDYNNADVLIDQLRNRSKAVESLSDIQNGKAGFSSGIAFFDHNCDETFGDVLKRADANMYSEKRMKE